MDLFLRRHWQMNFLPAVRYNDILLFIKEAEERQRLYLFKWMKIIHPCNFCGKLFFCRLMAPMTIKIMRGAE